MRVLVVTNFLPDDAAPQRGRWVRDQVEQIRRRGVEVELFGFPPGSRHYLPATGGCAACWAASASISSMPTTG